MRRIFNLRRYHYRPIVSIFLIMLITVTLIAGMVGCGGGGSTPIEIRTWYDLNAIRGADNLIKDYVLMNDLDSTTAGYEEVASPTANGGKGWQPIGGVGYLAGNIFFGSFDGHGHKICDLFINRSDEKDVGLFGHVGQGIVLKGVIRNLGVVKCNVTGGELVGGLVGASYVANTVTNCYATGTVTGSGFIGGLIGSASDGSAVSNCYFTGNVTGYSNVGGLLGGSNGTVSKCWATGSVTGGELVGGLVGANYNTVSNCYFTGSVTGNYQWVGGLVGGNAGTVSDCYATGSVTGGNQTGGLMGRNQEGTVNESYFTGSVVGDAWAGGLVGRNYASDVSDCYATGSVAGNYSVGGLAGRNEGNVSNSYSTGSVAGNYSVGGLVGANYGAVNNSFWDTETSGQATSGGGTGLNTTQMQDIVAFSDAFWDIVGVTNPDIRNLSYIWNIVNNVTYPFLSWQPV